MKKTSKGTLAAAAAVALLASGAGSLAFWNASGTVPGERVHSGQLKLVDGTGADACAEQNFTFADGSPYEGTDNPVDRLVPGDVLTKICTFDIVAVGQNLTADLSTTGPTTSANSAFPITVVGAFLVDGAQATSITSADNGKELTARIKVTFPYGTTADNTSQKTNKVVNDFTVTATQVNPNP
jgi:alternate signal-mediated exported protein